VTRYQQLRSAIARLASPADVQIAWLRHERRPLRPIRGDEDYCLNDKLALTFHDIFLAVGHMRDYGEITQGEIDAVRPIDDLLAGLSGNDGSGFWEWRALRDDERWEEVRACARRALASLPDEERPSDWLKDVSP
jgi:hypothetical protein